MEVVIIYSPHLNAKNAPNMHSLHHLFYTFSLFTSVIVMIVYWGMTHEAHLRDIKKEYKGNEDQIAISTMHAYIVHIVPQICSLILFLTSNTILMVKHMKGLAIFGITYSITNFIITKKRGKPLYWFLDWKDHKTLILLFVLHVVFLSMFFGMAKFDEWYTGRSLAPKKV
jgi:hypothetical protein